MTEKISRCPFHNTRNIREFDALNEEARANPWPYYDWLREDQARRVYKLPQEDSFYVVHRFEDVKQILSDTENFSSKIIPTGKSPFFVLMDGEEHKRIRTIAAEMLSQKNVVNMQSQIAGIIQNATEELLAPGNKEIFSIWADKIPLQILSFIFGMKTDDRSIKKLHDDAVAINRALFVTGGTGPRRSSKPSVKEKFLISVALIKNTGKLMRLRKLLGEAGMQELSKMLTPDKETANVPRPDFKAIPSAIAPLLDLMIHFATLIRKHESREADDGNNPVSILRNAVAAQEATITEMVMAGAFILFAGYETTSSILSNCLVHLATNPGMIQQLKNAPEQQEDFIEESLRYYTPVGRFLRKAVHDVAIGGTMIPRNAIVILMTGAGNTDPEKFENGCAFDMSRINNRQHLSFGKGAHYCIGAPLARTQIAIAIRELIAHAGSFNLSPGADLKMVVDRDNGILRYEKVWIEVKN